MCDEPRGPLGGESRRGHRVVTPFCLLFAAVGGFILLYGAIDPTLRILAARDWRAVPAVVTGSETVSKDESDGSEQRPSIRYRYAVAGREYDGSRVRFEPKRFGMEGESAEARRIVRRYPVGREITVYADPDDPADSVIDRNFHAKIGYAALFGTAFGGFGLGFLTLWRYALRRERRVVRGEVETSFAGFAGNLDAPDARALDRRGDTAFSPQPLVLVGGGKRRAKIIFLIAFNLIWNGGVWAFMIPMVFEHWGKLLGAESATGLDFWGHGLFAVVGLGFALVFGPIGLAVFWWLIYEIIGISNPRVRLTLPRHRFRLGEAVAVACDVPAEFTSMTLALEGREYASRREDTGGDGTSIVTKDAVFFRREVEADGPTISQSFDLPPLSAATFTAANGKIAWLLCVHGKTPRGRPDVKEFFEIMVLPPETWPYQEFAADESHESGGGLSLSLDRATLRPGEDVIGELRIDKDGRVRSAELRLIWHTAGKGERDVRIVASRPIPARGSVARESFRLPLPPSPPSFAGKVLQLHWSVELVADGDFVRQDLIVSPTGRPLDLHAAE